ncbi:hypothetical protein VM94_02234 [Janthinobacterium sp. KBS0711]|nr:hypothetical protein VM94_02234 [Janthinobacterium sp. KBS0711]
MRGVIARFDLQQAQHGRIELVRLIRPAFQRGARPRRLRRLPVVPDQHGNFIATLVRRGMTRMIAAVAHFLPMVGYEQQGGGPIRLGLFRHADQGAQHVIAIANGVVVLVALVAYPARPALVLHLCADSVVRPVEMSEAAGIAHVIAGMRAQQVHDDELFRRFVAQRVGERLEQVAVKIVFATASAIVDEVAFIGLARQQPDPAIVARLVRYPERLVAGRLGQHQQIRLGHPRVRVADIGGREHRHHRFHGAGGRRNHVIKYQQLRAHGVELGRSRPRIAIQRHRGAVRALADHEYDGARILARIAHVPFARRGHGRRQRVLHRFHGVQLRAVLLVAQRPEQGRIFAPHRGVDVQQHEKDRHAGGKAFLRQARRGNVARRLPALQLAVGQQHGRRHEQEAAGRLRQGDAVVQKKLTRFGLICRKHRLQNRIGIGAHAKIATQKTLDGGVEVKHGHDDAQQHGNRAGTGTATPRMQHAAHAQQEGRQQDGQFQTFVRA